MCLNLRRLDKFFGLETTCEVTINVQSPLIQYHEFILHFMNSVIEMVS
jgi:hypothetical protein